MKIAVDARPLRILRSFGNYTNQLIPLLLQGATLQVGRVAPCQKIEWYLLGEAKDEKLYQEKLPGLDYHFINLDNNWFSQNFRSFSNKIPQILKDQLFYASYINVFKFDILWHPDNKAFWFYFGKQITTVHDLMPLIFPQSFHAKFQYRFSYWLNTQALRFKANRITAISQSAKNDLAKFLKIPQDRITIIYQSGGEQYRVIEDLSRLDEVKQKFNLPSRFVLYAGGLNPHKNVETLVSAFAKYLEQSQDQETQLLIVGGGKNDLGVDQSLGIRQKIEEEGISNRTRIIEFSEAREFLPEIQNLAAVFIFPSLYEGFGMPPLEAMACGCPVISSNAASLPEVIDDAGLLFDPTNIDQLAEQIRQILQNENLRNELKQKGLEQAQKFSWEKCAKETTEILCK